MISTGSFSNGLAAVFQAAPQTEADPPRVRPGDSFFAKESPLILMHSGVGTWGGEVTSRQAVGGNSARGRRGDLMT